MKGSGLTGSKRLTHVITYIKRFQILFFICITFMTKNVGKMNPSLFGAEFTSKVTYQ
jgi:hypothetical protein